HQVVQLRRAAVFPVLDVMGVQTVAGCAAGNSARGVPALERAAELTIDRAGRSTATDCFTLAFEPHFTGGVAGQVLPLGFREQWAQMEGSNPLLDIYVHHQCCALAVGPTPAMTPSMTMRPPGVSVS